MSRETDIQAAKEAELVAARTLDLSGVKPLLIAAVVAFVGYLFLPHTRGISGWQVLAGASGVSLMEQVFSYASAAGAVATALTLISRRTKISWIAWMLAGFSFFVAIWAVWALGFEHGAGVGFFAAVVANLLAFLGFSAVAMRKSPEQVLAQERLRAATAQLDEMSMALQDSRSAQVPVEVIDDRRAQAAARHRRQQQTD